MDAALGMIAILAVFGFPTGILALHMRQRHREKMRALETQGDAAKVAALEHARSDLETRVRTLETIVTGGDRDFEERLKKLGAAVALPALPPGGGS